MEAIMFDEFSATLLSIYETLASASELPPVDAIFAAIARLIPFDTAAMLQYELRPGGEFAIVAVDAYGFDVARRYAIRAMHLGEERLAPDGSLLSDDPLLRATLAAPGVAQTRTAVLEPAGELSEYLRQVACQNGLEVAYPNGAGDGYTAIALWRAAAGQYFREPEVRVANLLLPHVRQVLALASGRTCVDGSNGMVVVDASGTVNYIDPAASAMLRQDWFYWRGPRLPDELWQALCGNAEHGYWGDGFYAQARPLGARWVVHCKPYLATRDGAALTRAEQRVAGMLSRGLAYKAIARSLDIEPSTVRNHAHSIYKKLQIASGRHLRSMGVGFAM
jgi:DNA-binding CsgD family transcriptional regulator